jgi:Cu(I)/Ag(I) efflux system protein CusF
MNGFMSKIGTAVCAAALTATVAVAQSAAINGEVKKIDEEAGKITLKHGPAKSLGMDEPMTMVYRVKDPAILKQINVGDKVSFEAENVDNRYTVIKLQKVAR